MLFNFKLRQPRAAQGHPEFQLVSTYFSNDPPCVCAPTLTPTPCSPAEHPRSVRFRRPPLAAEADLGLLLHLMGCVSV